MNQKQSQEEILNHAKTQLKFLERSFETFDKGIDREDEAIRISTHIRVLVHDTKNSTSALTQLKLKNIDFFSFIPKFERPTLPEGEMYDQSQGFYIPLAPMVFGGNYRNGTYLNINDGGNIPTISLSFDDWWSEIVLRMNGHAFTRERLVLSVANKLGGTHIDKTIPKELYEIFKKDFLPLTVSFDGYEGYPLNNAIYPTIRAIGEELHYSISRDFN